MRTRWAIGLGLIVVAAATVAWLPELQYLGLSAVREVHMLATARPVASMLVDTAVPAEARDQLRFVQDVKAFGIEQLGEAPSDSYRTFYDTHGQPLGWAVQAAWPDRLQAWEWHYPIVGWVPYKGFPRRDQAEAEAARLQARGLETVLWPIPAYSTLGWLPDPITSNLLREEPAELGAVILHELLHGTIYFPGQTNLNETMAQFVGEQGIVAYFDAQHSPQAARARALWQDEATFSVFINDLVQRLQTLYAEHLPWPQTLRGRLRILADAQAQYDKLSFQTEGYRRFDCRHWNNAQILGYVNYHDHVDWFQEAFNRMGSAARLVAFLKRVNPAQGGMETALQQLRTEGPDDFLRQHPVQPAPVARRTVVARWPWVAALLLWLLLRGLCRRRQEARWPWWLIGLGAVVGLLVGSPGGPWLLAVLGASLVVQRVRGQWVPPLDMTLAAGLAGWPCALVVGLLSWPAWWKRHRPAAPPR